MHVPVRAPVERYSSVDVERLVAPALYGANLNSVFTSA